jgi:type IV pilus assembly protein PilE
MRGGPTCRRATGFSMLELVIALAMVAGLAAYAMPSYVSRVARGHRIDAAIALHRAAQFLEAKGGTEASAVALPSGLDRAPAHGTAVYRLHMLPAGGSNGGYAVEARPIEAGPMRGDVCGTLVLDATGKRSNRATPMGAPVGEDCWLAR